MLLLTLRGTPTMYYGDELGIGRVAIPHEAVKDAWEKTSRVWASVAIPRARLSMGRHVERRIFERHALAACRSVLQVAQRQGSARRSRLDP